MTGISDPGAETAKVFRTGEHKKSIRGLTNYYGSGIILWRQRRSYTRGKSALFG